LSVRVFMQGRRLGMSRFIN